jgi:hypothetical protein
MRLPFEHAIVLVMASNPEPEKAIRNGGGQSAMLKPDSNRPNLTDFLELKRRMPRIAFQESEIFEASA